MASNISSTNHEVNKLTEEISGTAIDVLPLAANCVVDSNALLLGRYYGKDKKRILLLLQAPPEGVIPGSPFHMRNSSNNIIPLRTFRKLYRYLSSITLRMADVAVADAFHKMTWKPGFKPTKQNFQDAKERVKELVEKLKPEILVGFSSDVKKVLVSMESELPGIQVLTAPHPSRIEQQPKAQVEMAEVLLQLINHCKLPQKSCEQLQEQILHFSRPLPREIWPLDGRALTITEMYDHLKSYCGDEEECPEGNSFATHWVPNNSSETFWKGLIVKAPTPAGIQQQSPGRPVQYWKLVTDKGTPNPRETVHKNASQDLEQIPMASFPEKEVPMPGDRDLGPPPKESSSK